MVQQPGYKQDQSVYPGIYGKKDLESAPIKKG